MSGDARALVVFTNLPDRDSALALAHYLVEQRVAACVNVLDGCTSVYRGQARLHTEREGPVMIKTCSERFAALRDAIRARHPYELPEIIALPVSDALPDYLAWVSAETC